MRKMLSFIDADRPPTWVLISCEHLFLLLGLPAHFGWKQRPAILIHKGSNEPCIAYKQVQYINHSNHLLALPQKGSTYSSLLQQGPCYVVVFSCRSFFPTDPITIILDSIFMSQSPVYFLSSIPNACSFNGTTINAINEPYTSQDANLCAYIAGVQRVWACPAEIRSLALSIS